MAGWRGVGMMGRSGNDKGEQEGGGDLDLCESMRFVLCCAWYPMTALWTIRTPSKHSLSVRKGTLASG